VLLPLVLVRPSECSSVCSSFRSPCVRRPSALSPLLYVYDSLAQLIRRRSNRIKPTLNLILLVRGSIPHRVEFAGGRSDEGDGLRILRVLRVPHHPGIAKYLPWRYTTRHLAASLQYIRRRTCGIRQRPEGSSDRGAVGLGSGENNRSSMPGPGIQRYLIRQKLML
jgi:hypothetical protein